MAVQEIISIGFDYKRTEADKTKILEYLREVQSAIQGINGMQFNTGGLGNLIKNEEQIAKIRAELTQITNNFNKTQESANKAGNENANTSKKQLTAFELLVKAQKEADLTAKSYAATLGLESEEYKKAAAEADALKAKIDAINAARKVAPSDNSSNVKKEADAYAVLVQQFKEAEAAAKALGASVGVDSSEFKEAAQHADILKAKIDAINNARKPVASVDNNPTVKKEADDFQLLVAAQKEAEQTANALAVSVGRDSEEYKKAAASAALLKQQIEEIRTTTKAGGEINTSFTDVSRQTDEYKLLVTQFKEADAAARSFAVSLGLDSDEYKNAAAQADLLKGKIDAVNAARKGAPADNNSNQQIEESIRLEQLEQQRIKTQQEAIRLAKLEAEANAASLKEQQQQINIRIAQLKEENEIIKQIGAEQSIEAKQRKAEAEQRILQINEEIALLKRLNAQNRATTTPPQPANPATPATPAPIDTTPTTTTPSTAYEQYTFSLTENTEAQVRNRLAVEANRLAQNALGKEITRQGFATDEQISKMAELRREQLILNQYGKELAATERNLAAELASASGSMNQLEAKLNSLRTAYKALSDDQKNSDFGKNLLAEIQTLDTAVKGGDASIGVFNRNVGNYKDAFGGLNLAVQQILRETPSAANSINTFFLAISNNLPMLFDEIAKASEKTKEFRDNLKAAQQQQAAGKAAADAATAAAQQTEESLSEQINSIVDSIAASHDQAIALKEQIRAQIESGTATIEQAEATALQTEALITNAGASAEDAAALRQQIVANAQARITATETTVALEAQTVATAEAAAASRAAPTAFKGIMSSLFSLNTALTLGVLALTLYGGKIIDFVDSLLKSGKAFDTAAESAKRLNSALEETNGTYAKSVETIDELKIKVDLAKQGLIDKNVVLDEYNEKLGTAFGKVKDLNEVEATLSDEARVKAYLQAQLLKSAGLLALEDASKKALEAEKARRQKEDEFLLGGDVKADELPIPLVGQAPGFDATKFNKTLLDQQKEAAKQRKAEAIKSAEDEKDGLVDIADKLLKDAAELAKKFNLNIFTDDGKDTVDAESKYKDFLQRLLKARNDAELQALQDEAKIRESFANSPSFGVDERVLDEKKASAARLRIIEINQQTEIELNKLSLQEILRNEKISSKEKQVATAASEQERLNIIAEGERKVRDEIITATTKIAQIRKESIDKEAKELQEGYEKLNKASVDSQTIEQQSKTRSGLIDSLIDAEQKSFEKLQTIRTINYTKQQRELEHQYNTGKISFEKYQDSLKDIELKHQKTSLEDQLESLTRQYAAYEKYGTIGSAAALKIKKAIEETNAAIEHLGEELPKLGDNASGGLKEWVLSFEKVAAAINTATDLISEALYNSTERQKQAIEELEKRQQEAYEKEVENISNSTLSAEEKANRLKILEAERNAQAQQNRRKEQEAELKYARFQKSATITKIITESALAVMHQLTSGDPITATGRAIAAGALGAIQLSIAASAPLPQFRTGTKSAPEGYAVVGEEGRELRIEPTGEVSLTPEKASVTYLKEGTQIIPHHKTEEYLKKVEIAPMDIHSTMNKAMYQQTVKLLQPKEQKQNSDKVDHKILQAINYQTRYLAKAIQKSKASVNIYDNSAYLKWRDSKMNW